MPDVETARFTEIYLALIIRECVENTEPEDINWLVKQAANIKTIQPETAQEFAQPDAENGCRYSLRISTAGKKETEEETYEFSLKDMNLEKIKLDVSGKNVSVELATQSREKLINYSKNGKPSYVDKVAFQVVGIPEGKVFAATLKLLAGWCK